jgi:hypothetical protein
VILGAEIPAVALNLAMIAQAGSPAYRKGVPLEGFLIQETVAIAPLEKTPASSL